MKIVITLGGNALLKRGELMSAENQRANLAMACEAIADIARTHQLVLSHGNGPQVGLLALQSEAYDAVPMYPFDVLGAESQAMIGYVFAQEMRNRVEGRDVVSIVTQSIVDIQDPAFDNPTKFIGPIYDKEQAQTLEQTKGWTLKKDGEFFRRVVPSPKPTCIVELPVIKTLVDCGTLVIAAGGGGVPVIESKEGNLTGVEAVIDKDFAASILAIQLNADLLVIATDVEGVYEGWGTDEQKLIKQATPEALLSKGFAKGSMGPKVLAACEYVMKTGHEAVIGPLNKIKNMVHGQAGTLVSCRYSGIEY